MLRIGQKDLVVRIVRAMMSNDLNVGFQLVEGATTFEVQGKTITGTLAISQTLLKQANLEPLLGMNAAEQATVTKWGLDVVKTWTPQLAAERETAFDSLNSHLADKTFVASNDFSLADIVLYAALYNVPFQPKDRLSFPNVVRYFDLVQHLVKELAPSAALKLTDFDLNVPFVPPVKAAKPVKKGKDAPVEEKDNGKGKKKEKGEQPKKQAVVAGIFYNLNKDNKFSPAKLDMRVGKLINVERHPDAESLYVETVDLGEAEPRTVVSGLVKYLTIDQLKDQTVVLLCNLKPAKMRGIESQAMVLCATSADGNTVEFLQPPPGSKPGDVATFEGYAGTPEAVLKSKQKIWETIQPQLLTTAKFEASYKNAETGEVALLKTKLGVCKVKSVAGASIK